MQLLDEFRDVALMRDALREKLANLYLQSSDKTKLGTIGSHRARQPDTYPEAWYYLGSFAYDAKDYAKAAEYFSRAIIVRSRNGTGLLRIGRHADSIIDQAGEALKTLEKARAKFPNSFECWNFSRGSPFHGLKNYSGCAESIFPLQK